MNLLTTEIPKNSVRSSENLESLEDKIMDCNPVLEAFGNSKTIRNDNSSRFGKYVSIIIDTKKKKIVGSYTHAYLLEKSRITYQESDERNYHIFY